MALATAVLLARWQRFWCGVASREGIPFAARRMLEIPHRQKERAWQKNPP
jgi:hypothetical protein